MVEGPLKNTYRGIPTYMPTKTKDTFCGADGADDCAVELAAAALGIQSSWLIRSTFGQPKSLA